MSSVNFGVRPRSVLCALLACLLVGACDDDPSRPGDQQVVPVFANLGSIPRQGSLTITSPVPLDPASALDPANFVVINTCTGLRVPGSLSLSADGLQLTFTPTSALPFLTPLLGRVQNLIGVNGERMPQPFIFVAITEAPPVVDVSWGRMNSPTGDVLSGVSFISPDTGYVISTEGAAVYRTENGGTTFAATYRDPNVKLAKGIRAATRDSVFMIAAPNFGGTTFTTYGLFLSLNAGVTFNPVFTRSPADMRSLSMERVGVRRVLFMAGNSGPSLASWRYDVTTGEIVTFALGIADVLGNGGDISPDTTKAVIAGVRVLGFGPLRVQGVAYRSTNSGRTFQAVTVPLPQQLNGAGFVDNNIALLLGDSSTVLRLDVTTGAVTALGAAQGIPQTTVEPGTGITETFSFTKAEFAPNNRQIGWVIGEVLRRDPRPGVPDVRRGVILMSRDGGQTFTRQAVAGEPNFGLGFPTLYIPSDISALSNEFAVTVGYEGFIAARRGDTQGTPGVCSFETP